MGRVRVTRYSIKTHLRAGAIREKTVRTFLEAGVPADAIDVFCTPDQLEEYQEAVGDLVRVVPGGYGLRGQAIARRDYYDEGARVVHADDDLTGVWRLSGDRLEPVTDLPGLVDEAYELCEKVGASLWGVYPVPNPFFMSSRARIGLAFCIGQLLGVLNRKGEDYACPDKDDYEISLLRYEADGAVVRLEDVAVRAGRIRGNPGGMQADGERRRVNSEAVDRLLARWPDLVVEKKPRADGYREIRLRAPNRG